MYSDDKYDAYQYGGQKDQRETVDVNFVMRDSEPEHTPKQPKKGTGKWKKWMACICMAVVFGVVASVVFQGTNFVIGKFVQNDNGGKNVASTTVNSSVSSKVDSDIAKVAEHVMPSVVSITNLSVQEIQSFFFGGTTVQETKSSGSGIIVGQNGSELLIVSNNHVVEGSKSLTVLFADGETVEAQIKGTDSNIDLAVVAVPLSSIKESTLDAIKVATLGDSDSLAVGEPAIAIGNALGYGQSVTCGIISALNRTIEGFDSELIQTDAAINPGNSGGALLNAKGEVIGINTVKVNADAVEGMGYAIPISDVQDIMNELMNKETRSKVEEHERGAIGIQGVDVGEDMARIYNMPQGVFVKEVIEGSAAEKANLPKGCIITKFDGSSVNNMKKLQDLLQYYKAGEKVELEVQIPGENGEYSKTTYEITLGKAS